MRWFQYTSFLRKEYQLIKTQPKLLMLCLVFSLMPAIQLIPGGFVGLFDFYVPYSIVFVAIVSAEFVNTLINAEFDIKAYELLKVSPIPKSVIISGKITLPLLLSLVVFSLGIVVNAQLQPLTSAKIASHFFSFDYLLYALLTFLFSHLFVLYAALRGETIKEKEQFTLHAGIAFVINFMIYCLYFLKAQSLVVVILMSLISITYLAILRLYNKTASVTITSRQKLIQPTYSIWKVQAKVLTNDYIKLRYLSVMLGLSCIIHFYSPVTLDPLLIQFAVILSTSSLSSKFIFEGVIRNKQVKIYPILKVSTVSINQTICSHFIRPLLMQAILNVSLCLIVGYPHIIQLMLMSLVVLLSSLMGGFLVTALLFKTHFQMLSAGFAIGLAVLCLLTPNPQFAFITASVLLYSISYIVYDRYFEIFFK